MEYGGGPTTPLVVTVGDSRDARLFVELSSFGADLSEAQHALDLAISGKEEDSPLNDASAYMIGFAAVAYCRTILHSNVRRRLTDYIEVPPELLEIHNQVKTFRNATIAHSQSDLSVTYPVGVLDARTLEVRGVVGATVISPLPWLVVQRFRTLLAAMEELLDEAIQPVRVRLEGQLRGMDRKTLASGARPKVLERLAGEFNPWTKRPPYPTTQTFYWEREDAAADRSTSCPLDEAQ
ncbi:phage head-tail connector protein [Phycicoccus sp. SLBN-51]|uniref:phage head-tail connector protein n=1 Tax=Phycicoccus sp. SLBN-51 TaxID=2768447 RepID=UPI00114DD89A|nr:phage head-tail connector protein [Phycicoccus sp. SLBN-51]TQJ51844.1 hypothetical protein FBY26_3583 [Phycicoccus sp. SLBN-51]